MKLPTDFGSFGQNVLLVREISPHLGTMNTGKRQIIQEFYMLSKNREYQSFEIKEVFIPYFSNSMKLLADF